MSYIGNTNTTQAFTPAVDFFNGNGSTTAFTLSRPVASVAQVQVVISNVPQKPGDAFTVSGNTITFTSAPPSGTQNIYVYYTSPITQVIAPGQGTVTTTSLMDGSVTPAKLSTGGPSWDTSGNVTTTGTINNLTVGRGAGAVSTNTAVGASALAANTTGASNSAYGYQALKSVTTNADNSAFGTNAMRDTSTGGANSAFGSAALIQNTTGSNNVAVGQTALFSNTTASNSTAVGYQAAYSNTTGTGTIALGYQAGYTNTVGSGNTFLGYRAGYTSNNTSTANVDNTCVGGLAGYSLTTGIRNTFVGGSLQNGGAGYLMTTGSNNTILGNFTGNQGGLDIRTASKAIVLSDGDGNPAWSFDGGSVWSIRGDTTTTTGGIKFRNSSFTKYWEIASNDGTWFIADDNFSHYAYLLQNMTSWGFGSDRRMKKDIVDLDYGLDAVMAMKPKRYTFIASGKEDIGFIAQELKEVVPEAVSGEEIEYLETDTPQERASKSLGIGKELLIPVLVKAIQELKAEFDAYKEAHP